MAKILIVEDDEIQLLLCKEELEEEGYDVTLARTGEEALESIQDSPCDLVILDLRMPGMDGLEALGKIVSRHKKVKTVIHTAYPKCKGEFISWLADAYLTKSTDFSLLKKTVKELLVREIG
ncbi:MAG: response regulator [Thermodesulfobacteriota bacterium]